MKQKVLEQFKQSGIIFTKAELAAIDYADFGLNNFEEEGLSLIVYVNNQDYCAKEMILLPHQTCPEHKHPRIGKRAGKRETFRCRKGLVYLYVEGVEDIIDSIIPQTNNEFYTCRKQIVLRPGEQYTIAPDTKHWFQAGCEGAVISEFSTQSLDEYDIFTNPKIAGH